MLRSVSNEKHNWETTETDNNWLCKDVTCNLLWSFHFCCRVCPFIIFIGSDKEHRKHKPNNTSNRDSQSSDGCGNCSFVVSKPNQWHLWWSADNKSASYRSDCLAKQNPRKAALFRIMHAISDPSSNSMRYWGNIGRDGNSIFVH